MQTRAGTVPDGLVTGVHAALGLAWLGLLEMHNYTEQLNTSATVGPSRHAIIRTRTAVIRTLPYCDCLYPHCDYPYPPPYCDYDCHSREHPIAYKSTSRLRRASGFIGSAPFSCSTGAAQQPRPAAPAPSAPRHDRYASFFSFSDAADRYTRFCFVFTAVGTPSSRGRSHRRCRTTVRAAGDRP
jgi:hypothetical protein